MHLFFVTGGSKGLGEQICKLALERGHAVFSISRSNTNIKDKNFKHLKADLSLGLPAIKKVTVAWNKLNFAKFKHVHLINNAALLNPVGSLSQLDPKEMNSHLITNLISPILLSQACAAKTQQAKKNLTIFNIGSGASFRPIAGWSLYCAGKAGLKMFTENTALDLQLANNKKIKIYHFSPGVLDTQMQQTIRGLSKKDFPDVAKFKSLKSDDKLRSPTDVAALIVDFCLLPKKYSISSPLISVEDLEAQDG